MSDSLIPTLLLSGCLEQNYLYHGALCCYPDDYIVFLKTLESQPAKINTSWHGDMADQAVTLRVSGLPPTRLVKCYAGYHYDRLPKLFRQHDTICSQNISLYMMRSYWFIERLDVTEADCTCHFHYELERIVFFLDPCNHNPLLFCGYGSRWLCRERRGKAGLEMRKYRIEVAMWTYVQRKKREKVSEQTEEKPEGRKYAQATNTAAAAAAKVSSIKNHKWRWYIKCGTKQYT